MRAASQAFCAIGTQVFINDLRVAEVVSVRIGKQVDVVANYIPVDAAQSAIFNAIIYDSEVSVRIALPDRGRTEFRHEKVRVSGQINLSVIAEPVTLEFSFPSTGIIVGIGTQDR